MPDYGRLSQDLLAHTTPAESPLYPAPPWPLPGARVLKLVFETDAETALDRLPPTLSRSSPAYAIITVAHYPSSPVGPFSLAAQAIGCRARIFVRAFTVQAIVDSEPALAALREVWGFPCKLGRVNLRAGPRSATARVSRRGATLAEARLTRASAIDPELVRFDPVLNARTIPAVEEGKRHSLLEMIQIDPELTITESLRGRGQLAYPTRSEDDPWHRLPVLNMISAGYSRLDTELPLARFVTPY